jgi:integrase
MLRPPTSWPVSCSNRLHFRRQQDAEAAEFGEPGASSVVPKLRKAGVQCWSGWHGFRRGLATNLFELGVNETTIQAILRHSDVETTRKHYIKKNVVPEESKHAMKRLETVFRKMQKASRHESKLGADVGTKEASAGSKKHRKPT